MPKKQVAHKGSGSRSTKKARGGEDEPITPFQRENESDYFGIEWIGTQAVRRQKKKNFDSLSKRTLAPSRFADEATLEDLGLLETVELLMGRLGLWDLLGEPVLTFRALTLEFLSSFEFNRSTSDVSFQIFGTHYFRTTTEFCNLLGMPGNNEVHEMEDYSLDAFLLQIIGHSRTSAKTRQISHPALRYIQRVLSLSYFGRGETHSNFHLGELKFIWCMLKRNHGEAHYIPALGSVLADHIMGIIVNPSQKGEITIGGMITKIAYALGHHIDTSTAYAVPGPFKLDMPGLIKMKIIVASNISGVPRAPFYFLTEDLTRLPMDRIRPLVPQDPDTWLVALLPEEQDQEDVEMGEEHDDEHQQHQDQQQQQQYYQQPPPYYPEFGQITGRLDSMASQMETMTDLLTTLNVRHSEMRDDVYDLHDRVEDVEERVEDVYRHSWYTFQMADSAYRHDFSTPLPNADELPQYQPRARRARRRPAGDQAPPPPPQQ